MFCQKNVLASLLLSSLTLCSGAFAATQVPAPNPSASNSSSPVVRDDSRREDVRFECRFDCDDETKNGIGRIECEARGKLDASKLHDNDWVLGDRDDFLRVRCEDEDHDDNDSHGILYGRHFDDLFITGSKTTAPLIVVEDARHLEGVKEAVIILRHHGDDGVKVRGECRFERNEPPASVPGSDIPSSITHSHLF